MIAFLLILIVLILLGGGELVAGLLGVGLVLAVVGGVCLLIF